MAVVDYIDLAEDEYYVKVDVVDSITDEDSVEEDGNVEEDANVPQSENLAEAAASNSEQDATAATSLPMVGHGAATSSLMEEEATHPGNREVLATSDVAKEATRSGNHELIVVADCVGEAEQYEHEAEAVVFSSGQIVGCPHLLGDGLDLCISNGAGHPHGEPGSSTVHDDLDVYNLHAKEKPEEDTEKDEKCDAFAMSLSPQDKEKEISRFRKFYGRKGKKQVATDCYATASRGINLLDCEDLVSTYQGCSKTSQGNTVYDNGSKGCMVEACTNGAHGSTHVCLFHNSRPRKRCCAVIGCTTAACTSSRGRTDRCIKHGGGKRCRYDGCGKGAQGRTDHCIAHGGGRRCKFQGCRKSAQGPTDYCVEHGGGRRCKFLGCSASATGRTDFCSMHRTSLLSGNHSDQNNILKAQQTTHRLNSETA